MATKRKGIEDIIRQHQQAGRRVGLACGCFDVLHLGHIELFQFARTQADVLVVGVDSDTSVRRSKGNHRPIHGQDVRLRQLEELRSVDRAFVVEDEMEFGTAASTEVWRALLARLRPDVLVTHRSADRHAETKQALARELGIEIALHDREKRFSTTRIERLYLEDPAPWAVTEAGVPPVCP